MYLEYLDVLWWLCTIKRMNSSFPPRRGMSLWKRQEHLQSRHALSKDQCNYEDKAICQAEGSKQAPSVVVSWMVRIAVTGTSACTSASGFVCLLRRTLRGMPVSTDSITAPASVPESSSNGKSLGLGRSGTRIGRTHWLYRFWRLAYPGSDWDWYYDPDQCHKPTVNSVCFETGKLLPN